MRKRSDSQTERFAEQISALREASRITDLHPVAARFIYSLRLVAAYKRAKRDPAAELANRLGSIQTAIKALQLVETIGHSWPEPVLVQRFCCGCLSHDERTLGAMLDAAWHNDRASFNEQLAGLVRSERIDRVWDDALQLVMAEAASC